MSEENTQPAETAESEAEQVSAPQLGVNDLKLMANILEVVSNRGAIKANEMQAVGATYNKLEAFLKIVEAQQKDAAGKKTETGSANTIKDAGTSEKK